MEGGQYITEAAYSLVNLGKKIEAKSLDRFSTPAGCAMYANQMYKKGVACYAFRCFNKMVTTNSIDDLFTFETEESGRKKIKLELELGRDYQRYLAPLYERLKRVTDHRKEKARNNGVMFVPSDPIKKEGGIIWDEYDIFFDNMTRSFSVEHYINFDNMDIFRQMIARMTLLANYYMSMVQKQEGAAPLARQQADS